MRYPRQALFGSLSFALLLAACLAAPAVAAPARSTQAAGNLSPAGWSAPVRVGGGIYSALSEVVDSHRHVDIAASKLGNVYFITDRSGSWTESLVMRHLPNRGYREVAIALDANDRVYIAARRSSCDDCVPGGSEGIFLITDKGRAPGTFASKPAMIAPSGAGEPSLKVNGGHVFLAYDSPCCMPGPDAAIYLRTNASGHWTQSRVARHGVSPVLRIGSDGRPRVAFSRQLGITYAVAHSITGTFTLWNVPGTTHKDGDVALALDARDQPHLAWMHFNPGDSDGGSVDVFATRRTSAGWRAAEHVGPVHGTTNAIALDLESLGRERIAVGGAQVMSYVRSGGQWIGTTVAQGTAIHQVSIRRAANGRAVIAYTDFGGGVWVSTDG